MTNETSSEAAKAVVRRNTEEVQGGGKFRTVRRTLRRRFSRPHAAAGRTPDKSGARQLYKTLRSRFSRLSCRHPLAARRWRPRDDLQDLSRHAPGRVPGRGADWPQDSIRDGRRHAGAQRQDRRTLGRGQSLLPHAAARRLAREARAAFRTGHATSTPKGTSHDHRHHWIGRHRHSVCSDSCPRPHRGDHLQQPRAGLPEATDQASSVR